ncbi:MAG: Fructose-2,6-bisphosphatase [uncultured bacterium]|nr:MAG: Fructose-2,6-bisphosphatase [uncultured bacterium]
MKYSRLSISIWVIAGCVGILPGAVFSAETATQIAPPTAKAKFVEILATRQTLNKLRDGGFALYLRHGNTDNSRPDRMPSVDLNDCSTQRELNELGRQVSRDVGQALRKAGIPLSKIHISPLCRVKHTAQEAFPGQKYVIDGGLMYTANLTRQQKQPILARTRALLAAPVTVGKNRLIIAHAPNLMDLIGYFPKEATLVIFHPQGGDGFKYVASIPPTLWPELLR